MKDSTFYYHYHPRLELRDLDLQELIIAPKFDMYQTPGTHLTRIN